MSEPFNNEERLRRLMDGALRDLPLRNAPSQLEARVFVEIERRGTRPWRQRTFAHWPAPARAAFVGVCGILIGLLLVGRQWTGIGVHSLTASTALPLSFVRATLTLCTAAAELLTLLAHAIPAAWLYLMLTTGIVLYAMLFGLGAAAYRTLYLTPSDGR